MHEMGIAQQMVTIALESIPEDEETPRVQTMNLRIGSMAAVVEDSLRFCFEIITKDTPLEGTALVIEHVPLKLRCSACGNEWETETPAFRCPACSSGEVEIIAGRELDIDSLELAD